MTPTTAQNNRDLAADLIQAGRDHAAQMDQQRQRLIGHPELILMKQLEGLKRRAEAGEPVRERTLELR